MGTNFLNGYLYTNVEIYHINKIKEVTMEAKDSEEHEIKTEKIEKERPAYRIRVFLNYGDLIKEKWLKSYIFRKMPYIPSIGHELIVDNKSYIVNNIAHDYDNPYLFEIGVVE